MDKSASQLDGFLKNLVEKEQRQEDSEHYAHYHAPRFSFVEDLASRYAPGSTASVLDIGRSELSFRLKTHFAEVVTLGLPLEQSQSYAFSVDPSSQNVTLDGHIDYDLNDAARGVPIPAKQQFDVIVFAEVIEHLHAAPELVCFALNEILKPDGVLIIQTPNAAALPKRVLSVLGRNPYERIRADTMNPGHFREYTRAELIEIAHMARFEVVAHAYKDYFAVHGGFAKRLAQRTLKFLSACAPSLSRGQTIVLRRVG